ncbi:alpha-amylase family glycosyl hydrolase [Micropruina sp.]|uniref:alpha-amylase family glycosyl hydrolase n=1 Tax=Micropruina sp. TaxID=2737536 RepID=UPI0039E257DE
MTPAEHSSTTNPDVTASGAPVLDGMGAIVHSDGVGFRVWAPNAQAVSVRGSFNAWSAQADPLAWEGNGYWYGFAAGAKTGDEYQFRLTNGEQGLDRIDPYAFQVTNSVGNGIVYDHAAFDWQGDGFACPPHNELVIYELHVGSFAPQRQGVAGTFDTVQAAIEHFQHLGVSAIQLMPSAEFAGDFSWGYNPAHIFAVESSYGGPDALKTLVREVHKAGIAVIMDVVYNHFGPSDLDLWQFDGWSENGKGGIYFYNDWRSATPWGDTRPDYGRGEVRQFIRDNAFMWLRDYHVDGLRFDMTPYMRSVDADADVDLPDGWSLQSWLNRSIRQEFSDAITIAEDLHGNPAVTSTGPDGAAYHAQWEAKFVHPVREAIIVASDAYRSVPAVADAVSNNYGDSFARVIYTESHDEVANGKARVPQEVDPGDPDGYWAQKRSTLGAGLVFTAPGIPMIFQGQEFLEGGWFRDTVPLDWNRNDEFQGIVRLYRDLIELRRDYHSTTRGLKGSGLHIIHGNDDANLLAFQRWYHHGPGDDVVVIANLDAGAKHDYRIGMPQEGLWKLRFNSDATIYSAVFGDYDSFDLTAHQGGYDGMAAHADIAIAPYSLLIYSRDD